MGVEPTLDQEAGRATVLKTAYRVFPLAFCDSLLLQQVQYTGQISLQCAPLAHVGTQFGVKSDVKKPQVDVGEIGRCHGPEEIRPRVGATLWQDSLSGRSRTARSGRRRHRLAAFPSRPKARPMTDWLPTKSVIFVAFPLAKSMRYRIAGVEDRIHRRRHTEQLPCAINRQID